MWARVATRHSGATQKGRLGSQTSEACRYARTSLNVISLASLHTGLQLHNAPLYYGSVFANRVPVSIFVASPVGNEEQT